MGIAWGIVVTFLSALCWGGQALSWFAPSRAVGAGLMESEDSVEPAFFADGRGEALWDTFTLWTMLVAGVLLVADQAAWPYFGLVGGGAYTYFAGRGIAARLAMQRRHLRIGTPESVRTGFFFLTVWGVMGAVTIAAAAIALEGR